MSYGQRLLLRGSMASLRGARNPHVPIGTLRFLRSVRLALKPLATQSLRASDDPKQSIRQVDKKKTGRGDTIRTCDPLLPKQLRYRAALHPESTILPGLYFAAFMGRLAMAFARRFLILIRVACHENIILLSHEFHRAALRYRHEKPHASHAKHHPATYAQQSLARCQRAAQPDRAAAADAQLCE
jgi:hypothetical protein